MKETSLDPLNKSESQGGEKHTLMIQPVPASRPRVTRWGTYYSKTYQKFRDEIKPLIPDMELKKGLIKATQTFYFKIPKSYTKKQRSELGEYCTKNVDNDNLEKALWDSLNGIAFDDDRQIVENVTAKKWSKGEGYIEFKIEKII